MGVVEGWSGAVRRYYLFLFLWILITDLPITDYWLLITLEATAEELNVPTNHFSPLTSHLSRPSSHSINERARGQHDNQDGSFGSDLPIR